ncbi:hypothetical protein EMIT0P43_190051 [Pseudomonas jessenii]
MPDGAQPPLNPDFQNDKNPLWERACSRMRWVRRQLCRLTQRIREQARSHICFVYG